MILLWLKTRARLTMSYMESISYTILQMFIMWNFSSQSENIEHEMEFALLFPLGLCRVLISDTFGNNVG